MSNTKGRCPICGLFMREFRTHYWRDMKLNFPYELYRCPKHGIYIWSQNEHVLVDFESIKDDANISEISSDEEVQWFDPKIVEMKCSICGEKWKQYEEFPAASAKGTVFCPNNHANNKDEAIMN
jgi:hypothetical protein